jgi:hypothetical protein
MLQERVRGQPLAVLMLIVGGWIAFRVMAWQPPHWNHAKHVHNDPPSQIAASETALYGHGDPASHVAVAPVHAAGPDYGIDRGPISPPAVYLPFDPRQPYLSMDLVPAASQRGTGQIARPPRQAGAVFHSVYGAPGARIHDERPEGRAMAAAGHQLMWMAALARMSVPPELASYVGQSSPEAPSPVPMSPGTAQKNGDRWSADSWLLLRQEGNQTLASGRPVYGGSQAGAVLRYHLAPTSGHRPMAYLRASQAMGGIS